MWAVRKYAGDTESMENTGDMDGMDDTENMSAKMAGCPLKMDLKDNKSEANTQAGMAVRRAELCHYG